MTTTVSGASQRQVVTVVNKLTEITYNKTAPKIPSPEYNSKIPWYDYKERERAQKLSI